MRSIAGSSQLYRLYFIVLFSVDLLITWNEVTRKGAENIITNRGEEQAAKNGHLISNEKDDDGDTKCVLTICTFIRPDKCVCCAHG